MSDWGQVDLNYYHWTEQLSYLALTGRQYEVSWSWRALCTFLSSEVILAVSCEARGVLSWSCPSLEVSCR